MTRGLIFAIALALAPAAQAANLVHGSMPGGDVVLHFVSPERFNQMCRADYLACTYMNHPCEIYLHQGVRIWGNPASGYSGPDDQMDSAKIFHELLHCAIGRWHPE